MGCPLYIETNNQLRSHRWVSRHNTWTQYTRRWRYQRSCQISQSSCNCGWSDVRSGFTLKFQASRNVIVKTWKLSQWDNEVNRLYSIAGNTTTYVCVQLHQTLDISISSCGVGNTTYGRRPNRGQALSFREIEYWLLIGPFCLLIRQILLSHLSCPRQNFHRHYNQAVVIRNTTVRQQVFQ